MIRTLVVSLLAALVVPPVFFVAVASVDVAPPNEEDTVGREVPDVELVDENGTPLRLRSLAGKPLVLNPIFTRCPYACPTITTSLRDALAAIGTPGVDYQVVTVSFDPADTAADLRAYRDRLELPAGWCIATAAPGQLDTLLAAIDFRYAPALDGGFAHANVVAVLTPDQRVSGYVHGIVYEDGDIRRALLAAVTPPSLVDAFKPLIVAAAGLSLVVTLVVLFATRRRGHTTA
jgi:protein SCO1/2